MTEMIVGRMKSRQQQIEQPMDAHLFELLLFTSTRLVGVYVGIVAGDRL
jgi:hypothetical protein